MGVQGKANAGGRGRQSVNYQHLFFDLDGTLGDSQEGIQNSIYYAMDRMGISRDKLGDIKRYIGPPLVVSFTRFWQLDEAGGKEAVRTYREYYAEKGWKEVRVYDGMEQTLKTLKEAGAGLYVVTSKPTVYAEKILQHYGLAPYFETIRGVDFQHDQEAKQDLLQSVIEKHSITDLHACVMIGDRRYDMEAAKAVGTAAIGALFGFGSAQELQNAGADHLAHVPLDILRINGMTEE